MIIAATGDVHSPYYYEDFVRAIDNLTIKPDLFLLVGDMVHRGNVDEYEKIYNVLFGKIDCPIIACFGNNEFEEQKETLKQKYREIRFLDDQSIVFEIGRISVGIYGTTGSLDQPTRWQKSNIPNVEQIYRERIIRASKHLERMLTHVKILLMHYAPTYKILEGENPRFFPNLGCQAYENVIMQQKPNLVVCGHSHKGKKMVWVDAVPVFNVSLPLNKEIVVIDTTKIKPGITKFI